MMSALEKLARQLPWLDQQDKSLRGKAVVQHIPDICRYKKSFIQKLTPIEVQDSEDEENDTDKLLAKLQAELASMDSDIPLKKKQIKECSNPVKLPKRKTEQPFEPLSFKKARILDNENTEFCSMA